MITKREFSRITARLIKDGHYGDIEWSVKCKLPETPEEFAREAIFVICNSGMKNTVARKIFREVILSIETGCSASDVFRHEGKCKAIDAIWRNRRQWHLNLIAAVQFERDEGLLDFCSRLPWIGPITKYHLAKNFGAQVAKPDVHLQRLADRENCTPQLLCERLALLSGYTVATVDVLLWRACATGVINSKTGEIRT